MVVVKHIGSAHDNKELNALKESAALWIEKATKQPSLFSNALDSAALQLKLTTQLVEQCRYVGFRYALVYESLYELCRLLMEGSKEKSKFSSVLVESAWAC